MAHRPLDPRRVNVALDTNALNLDGSARDALVHRFNKLDEAGEFIVVLGGLVRSEALHPRTPSNVREAMVPKIFNLQRGLIAEQMDVRRKVAAIMQGNAKPETHAADAQHLCEADEYGAGFFITQDQRILAKRAELRAVLKPSLFVVTIEEFFEALAYWQNLDPDGPRRRRTRSAT